MIDLKYIENNQYLISMVPVEEILRLGYELGLNENIKVLDLCCGYGTVSRYGVKHSEYQV